MFLLLEASAIPMEVLKFICKGKAIPLGTLWIVSFIVALLTDDDGEGGDANRVVSLMALLLKVDLLEEDDSDLSGLSLLLAVCIETSGTMASAGLG